VVSSTRNARLSFATVCSVYCVCGGSILYTRCVCECSSPCVCFERVESPPLRVLSLIRNKQLSQSLIPGISPAVKLLLPAAFQLVARHRAQRGNCQPQQSNISSHSIPEFSLRNTQPRQQDTDKFKHSKHLFVTLFQSHCQLSQFMKHGMCTHHQFYAHRM